MNFPAQSEIWRLNIANGQTGRKKITQIGKSRILFRTRQVFPIILFPSELIIEELRVVCLKQLGPWAQEILSIMATDIASVNAASGLFFGHIHVKSLTGGPEILVDSLPRRDVYRVRSLVEGIAMSAREGLTVQGEDLEAEKQSLYQAGRIN
ncbi:MAG: hypothetical protein AAB512_00615 [Patescibacteria group bacterium]